MTVMTVLFCILDPTGNLRFQAMNVLSDTLQPLNLLTTDICPSDNAIYDYVYMLLLNETDWIGHGIRSYITDLEKVFANGGKEFPRHKDIIDTAYFVASETKLAKLAVHFGLGKEVNNNVDEFCRIIKLCGKVMSLYEPDEMKKYEVNDGFHPMISYLKDVTASFNKLKIEREIEVATNAAD